MASSSQHRCVFVGNIPYDATEEQLVQICEEVGPVVSFRLVLDRETGKPKGYGFCEYKDEETALSARRNLQGYEINGRQLRVDFAENDKNADRNREQQGRGGPGLTQNIDIQRPSIALSVPIHQPLGCQLAESAASVMARHLGGDQTRGIPTVYGQESVSDPLTLYLAKMSRDQLHEVMAELKGLVAQNKAMARQLLQTNPQLPKALFQAQIMLGMITPQMLQMPQILQSGNAGLQSQVFGIPKILPPNVPSQVMQNVPQIGHTGVSTIVQGEQMPNSTQNPLSFQPTINPLHRTPVQSQFNIGQVSNSHIQLQGTMQSVPTNLAEKSIPATVGTLSPSPPLAAVQAPISFQPSLMQQSGHATGKAVTQFQPALTATGTWQQPIQPQQPSSQFSAEIETTLLQQVMSLTPEQMGSLSAEQRQQVMQLQQMLRG